MNTTKAKNLPALAGVGVAVRQACINSCEKLRHQINTARINILAEARETLATHDRMLQLALNEAEAIAWQTMYPQLVFPTLAAEKVQSVVNWSRRQQTVRGARRISGAQV